MVGMALTFTRTTSLCRCRQTDVDEVRTVQASDDKNKQTNKVAGTIEQGPRLMPSGDYSKSTNCLYKPPMLSII
jgi:ribosomal protein S3AE